ncbi:hypothetical protein OC844_005821, partial [Tilletia horrida]
MTSQSFVGSAGFATRKPGFSLGLAAVSGAASPNVDARAFSMAFAKTPSRLSGTFISAA